MTGKVPACEWAADDHFNVLGPGLFLGVSGWYDHKHRSIIHPLRRIA
jgi:hypothetical protein